jgi:hypothetical protein
MSAGYSIPCTATLVDPPSMAPMAVTKGGPATDPMLPASVVPRAKRTVMALHAPPFVTSFWVEEVRAASATGGAKERRRYFMVRGRVEVRANKKLERRTTERFRNRPGKRRMNRNESCVGYSLSSSIVQLF